MSMIWHCCVLLKRFNNRKDISFMNLHSNMYEYTCFSLDRSTATDSTTFLISSALSLLHPCCMSS
ncbi:UNVERIFIED_CONTAM: hypothetical protein FKN15_018323 [Acipenser sinensis]